MGTDDGRPLTSSAHSWMSAWGWWRPPACWTASTATTKRLEWILSCFNKFPVTRHSDRPFGVHAFDFLSVRGREDPDRQVHLTEIVKMLSIPLWYKQWCCNLVKKLWMPNSFYMICGCIIALSIGDLDRGWHLRWDRLVQAGFRSAYMLFIPFLLFNLCLYERPSEIGSSGNWEVSFIHQNEEAA